VRAQALEALAEPARRRRQRQQRNDGASRCSQSSHRRFDARLARRFTAILLRPQRGRAHTSDAAHAERTRGDCHQNWTNLRKQADWSFREGNR
jgi:uncharacterized protein YecT (DUF1311 family)